MPILTIGNKPIERLTRVDIEDRSLKLELIRRNLGWSFKIVVQQCADTQLGFECRRIIITNPYQPLDVLAEPEGQVPDILFWALLKGCI